MVEPVRWGQRLDTCGNPGIKVGPPAAKRGFPGTAGCAWACGLAAVRRSVEADQFTRGGAEEQGGLRCQARVMVPAGIVNGQAPDVRGDRPRLDLGKVLPEPCVNRLGRVGRANVVGGIGHKLPDWAIIDHRRPE